MPAIVYIDPLDDPSWAALVEACPESSIYQHPAWLRLLHEQYGFKLFALCVVRDGTPTAGIPVCEMAPLFGTRRWICLPFSDRCGPLATLPADAEIVLDALAGAARIAKASLEIRSAVAHGLQQRADHWNHVTRLDAAPEQLHKRFHPDVRRRLRKASVVGLTAELRRDPPALDLFYRLHLATRRRQGVPTQPRRFFSLLHRHVIEPGLGFVALTRHGERCVSAGVFCAAGRTVTYKYGASDPRATELAPNHPMLWAALRFASESGFERFDFGKTSFDNPGLRTFKHQWASEETELPYSYAPHAPTSTAFKAISAHVVAPLIRHTPELICRVVGELLYKRFGT